MSNVGEDADDTQAEPYLSNYEQLRQTMAAPKPDGEVSGMFVLGTLGVFMLVAAVVLTIYSIALQQHGERVPANVLSSHAAYRSHYATVSFTTRDGQFITTDLDGCRRCEPGDVITVLYDPSRPKDNVVDAKFGIPYAFVAALWLCTLLAAFLFRRVYRRREQIHKSVTPLRT